MAQTPLVGKDFLIIEFSRSHSDTPKSVALLWTSDQPDEGTSTCQHTTLTRDKLPCAGGIRTCNLSNRAAADPRLRPCGHRDRKRLKMLVKIYRIHNIVFLSPFTFFKQNIFATTDF